MKKKQLTEEEKAATPLSDLIASEAQDDASIGYDLRCVLHCIRVRFRLDDREACCVLRDYAQVLVARHMDERIAETQARIKELEGKLSGGTQ